MPQLITITLKSGWLRNFKCPYHAKVMKMLEMVSRMIVLMAFMLPEEASEVVAILLP